LIAAVGLDHRQNQTFPATAFQRVASLSTTQRYIEGSTAAKRRVVNM
jgi:hypothetical protein